MVEPTPKPKDWDAIRKKKNAALARRKAEGLARRERLFNRDVRRAEKNRKYIETVELPKPSVEAMQLQMDRGSAAIDEGLTKSYKASTWRRR